MQPMPEHRIVHIDQLELIFEIDHQIIAFQIDDLRENAVFLLGNLLKPPLLTPILRKQLRIPLHVLIQKLILIPLPNHFLNLLRTSLYR